MVFDEAEHCHLIIHMVNESGGRANATVRVKAHYCCAKVEMPHDTEGGLPSRA